MARITVEGERSIYYEQYVDGTLDESVVHPTVEQITGRPPRTFREWAVDHADRFQ